MKDGLYRKYSVTKLTNPEKDVDAIVLEFDDPIARKGIKAWAEEMAKNGYEQVEIDIQAKLKEYEQN